LSLKSYIFKSYKWWFLTGTIFFIIYIATFVYLITYTDRSGFPWEIQYLPIIFLGGIFGEIISKSKNIIHSFKAWIYVGLYQGILFFLVYWVGFQFIINQALTKPSSVNPFEYIFSTTFFLVIIFLIPANIAGGGIIFLGRYLLKEKK
jgi:hypothetical protein